MVRMVSHGGQIGNQNCQVFEFDVRLTPEPPGGCGGSCSDSVFATSFIKGALPYSADVYGGVIF